MADTEKNPNQDNQKETTQPQQQTTSPNSGFKLNDDGSIPTNYLASSMFTSMSSIPFASLIGDPLRACVVAQANCNQEVLKYMQTVAFGSQGKDDESTKAVKFDFEFMQGGKLQKLSVPLITLVPINFFTIDKFKMQFKASINATNNSSSVNQTIENEINATKKKVDEQKANEKKQAEEKEENKTDPKQNNNNDNKKKEESTLDKITGVFQNLMPTVNKLTGTDTQKPANPQNGDNTSYSSKKDSKSTRESKYSVETTVDFEISAVPSDMPAGLSKLLEVLNGSISVINPEGELLITEKTGDKGSKVYITYKNGDGIFAPTDIKITPEASAEAVGDGILATFANAGKYTVKAGKQTGTIEIKE